MVDLKTGVGGEAYDKDFQQLLETESSPWIKLNKKTGASAYNILEMNFANHLMILETYSTPETPHKIPAQPTP